MKRALVIGAALLALALFCLAAADAAVGRTAEQVEYTETVLYGNSAAARGLRVAVGANCDRRLFWNTTLAFGETATAETDFRFQSAQAPLVWQTGDSGLTLWLSFNGGYSFPYGRTEEELIEAYGNDPAWETTLPLCLAAAAQTKAGETRMTALRLRDFYAYYPIEHSVGLGRVSGGAWEENVQTVRDFFRIPVPEDYFVSVEVAKDPDGRILRLDFFPEDVTPVDTVAVAQKVRPQAPALIGVSAVTEKYCFFAFASYDENGRIRVDTSAIPGGLGVYRLPYTRDGDLAATYYAEELKTVFPLPDGEPVAALGADEQGRPLLVTNAQGRLVLTVLDPSGETALQRVELGESAADEAWWGQLHVFDGWLLLENADGDLYVAEREANGLWRAALRAEHAELKACWPDGERLTTDRAFAWDGKRLAVVNGRYDRSGVCSGGFLAALYDAEGLRYLALLESSLDVAQSQVERLVRVESDVGEGGFRAWFT